MTDSFTFRKPYILLVLAAVVATDPSVISTRSFLLRVVTEEGDENGRTKVDTVHGRHVSVGEDVDMDRFDEIFLEVLNRE